MAKFDDHVIVRKSFTFMADVDEMQYLERYSKKLKKRKINITISDMLRQFIKDGIKDIEKEEGRKNG